MDLKEYFDKIPLSTKIVGVILIGVLIVFAFYAFHSEDPRIAKQQALSNWWENQERQQKVNAENAQKAYEKSVKDYGEIGDKVRKENNERRKVQALEGIKDNLDK